jgi:uroporphyrinogen decarboxylase
MGSDYAFNANPFFSDEMFNEFVAPYLARAIAGFRDRGFYSVKHTDGNIAPIVSAIVDCKPDALHSIDPQGGMDLKEISAKYGDRVALCGNVNCALLQTGTEEEAVTDIKRALHDGMTRGAGYIFCTSNCAYTGMPLERYELMIRLWREHGIYGK